MDGRLGVTCGAVLALWGLAGVACSTDTAELGSNQRLGEGGGAGDEGTEATEPKGGETSSTPTGGVPGVGTGGDAGADTGGASAGTGGVAPMSPRDPRLCGNGEVDSGEECDDGNLNPQDACVECSRARCGDGVTQLLPARAAEECDDGNAEDDDDCRNTCVVPTCGDGQVDEDELCDDANEDDSDGCTSACVPTFCGDGRLQSGEACDDGNEQSGDGCSSECLVESGFS